MRKVFKYEVPDIGTIFTVQIPAQATVVHFEKQATRMCFWVVLDPDAPKEARELTVFGTGWDIEDDRWRHIASMQDAPYVWHLFERRAHPTGGDHR